MPARQDLRMHEDFAQRRRVALAVAITVILVPAAFLLNRGNDEASGEPIGTLVGPALIPGQSTVPGDDDAASDRPTATDPMGTTPSEYVQGTVPVQADDPATIAIPRVRRAIQGTASFSRSITDPTTCQVSDAAIPFQSAVTVTNLDNSQAVQCIASVGGPTPTDEVVLSAEAFLRIGDLTDVPLSVEISW